MRIPACTANTPNTRNRRRPTSCSKRKCCLWWVTRAGHAVLRSEDVHHSSTLQTHGTCVNSRVVNLAEEQGNLQSNIVIGVKAGHRASHHVGSNASVNKILMPLGVCDSSFHDFTR